ncbi:MAG: peptidylprolyl isomerase [Planctomycetota bacterium]
MDFRIAFGSLLLIGVTATAQVKPSPQPTPPQPTPVAPLVVPAVVPGVVPAVAPAQDPDRPEPTAAEKLAELTKEKQRLQQEVAYVRNRTEHAKELLRTKLGNRQQQAFRSIDAGIVLAPVPKVAPAARRFAQLVGDEHRDQFPADTLVLVNNRPITQARFDQIKNYLKELPSSGDDSMQSQRALFELIRIEAVAASFEESEGEAQVAEAMSQLQQGKPMADVAKAFGVLTGAQPDGSIEVTRNSAFGSLVELIAFQTPTGQPSRPFRNANGYVILRTDRIEKGATPDLDKAIGSAVQVRYTADEASMQKAQFAINAGQVDILVRDQHVLDMLPQMFKAPPPMPAGATDEAPTDQATQMLSRKMEQLQAEIKRLSQSKEVGSEVRIKALEEQLSATKQALRESQKPKTDAQKGDARDSETPAKETPAKDTPAKMAPAPKKN